MTGYQYLNYVGGWWKYTGPYVKPYKPFFDYYGTDHGYKSFTCSCDIHYIDCSPGDKLVEVLRCDNRNSVVSQKHISANQGCVSNLFVNMNSSLHI